MKLSNNQKASKQPKKQPSIKLEGSTFMTDFQILETSKNESILEKNNPNNQILIHSTSEYDIKSTPSKSHHAFESLALYTQESEKNIEKRSKNGIQAPVILPFPNPSRLQPSMKFYRINTGGSTHRHVKKILEKDDEYIQEQLMIMQDQPQKEEVQEQLYVQVLPKILRETSEKSYYQSSKMLNKILDYNSFFDQKDMNSSMLRVAQRKTVLPQSFSLLEQTFSQKLPKINKPKVHNRSHLNFHDNVFQIGESVNISNFSIGHGYHQMIGQALDSATFAGIQSLNLHNNRLNLQDVYSILQKTNERVINIDISDNYIGASVIKKEVQLNEKLNQSESQGNNFGEILMSKVSTLFEIQFKWLRHLNLEKCQLGNRNVSILLRALYQSSLLSNLNLSNNEIGSEDVIEKIVRILGKISTITQLYLHWNLISQKGGQILFGNLSAIENLKVLDLSYNRLGCISNDSNGLSCSQEIAQFISLSNSTQMIHLDLSNNQFQSRECVQVAESLKGNTQIVGFHFEGNSVNFQRDAQGFLMFSNDDEELELSAKIHRIKGVQAIDAPKTNFLHDQRVYQKYNHKQSNSQYNQYFNSQHALTINQDRTKIPTMCWICQGWVEYSFTFTKHISSDLGEQPIFVHIDVYGWKSLLMKAEKDGREGQLQRKVMLPPNKKIYFFFSNPICPSFVTNKDYQTEVITQQNQRISIKESIQYNFLKDVSIKCEVSLIDINFIISPQFTKQLYSQNDYIPQFDVPIREQEELVEFVPNSELNEWTITKSIWADWQKNTPQLFEQCFEYDWENSKIQSIVKEQFDFDHLRAILMEQYPLIKMTYDHLSGIAPQQGIWCIPFQVLQNYLSDTIINDHRQVRLVELQSIFQSSLSVKSKYIPQGGMVRHDFMEFIVKLAQVMYIDSEQQHNYYEAVRQLLNQILLSKFKMIKNPDIYRLKKLWTENNDILIKHHMDEFQLIFNHLIENQQNEFIRQKVFQSFLKQMKLIEGTQSNPPSMIEINESEILDIDQILNLIFRSSMMAQVDETKTARTSQMRILEFIEALSRVSQVFSFSFEKSINGSLPNLNERRSVISKDIFTNKFLSMVHYLSKKVYQEKQLENQNTVFGNSSQYSSELGKGQYNNLNPPRSPPSGNRSRLTSNVQINVENESMRSFHNFSDKDAYDGHQASHTNLYANNEDAEDEAKIFKQRFPEKKTLEMLLKQLKQKTLLNDRKMKFF